MTHKITAKEQFRLLDPKEKEKYYNFLDQLRESGQTNMYGAGVYVIDAFGVSIDLSTQIVLSWMDTFEARQEKKQKEGARG